MSWETETGLLDDFDHTVTEAWYGTDDGYMNGTRLLLNLRGPASENGEVVDPEYKLMFSCGDGWEAINGGAGAEHVGGKTKFNANSAIGRVINALKSNTPEVFDALQKKGDALESQVWENLNLHWKRMKVSEFKNADGELVEVVMPIPVKAVGAVGTVGSKKERSTRRERPARRKEGNVIDEITEFAKDFDDFDEFLDAVFDKFPQADTDDDLYDAVTDENGAIWKNSR